MPEHLLAAIRQCTPAEKELVLAELAKDLFRAHGRGPVAIHDETRRTVGYVFGGGEPDYETAFPAPGTPEWGAMNSLRQTLIRKQVRGELTADERSLYELLQRKSLHAADAAFPFRPA
jgi:hypothetical protein